MWNILIIIKIKWYSLWLREYSILLQIGDVEELVILI